jgi:hypothetical protein
MGATLYQLDGKGTRRVISYASAKFSPTEAKYHSNEQECLAVVWALRKYRPLLEDGRFTFRTDNAALTWLDRVQDERGKLSRWAMLLNRFNFDIEHVPGKKNQLHDALFRLTGNEVFREDPEEADTILPPTRAEPEEENFVAVLGAADLRQRIVDSQGAEPELYNDHLSARAFPLRKAQELYEPRRPPPTLRTAKHAGRGPALPPRGRLRQPPG